MGRWKLKEDPLDQSHAGFWYRLQDPQVCHADKGVEEDWAPTVWAHFHLEAPRYQYKSVGSSSFPYAAPVLPIRVKPGMGMVGTRSSIRREVFPYYDVRDLIWVRSRPRLKDNLFD